MSCSLSKGSRRIFRLVPVYLLLVLAACDSGSTAPKDMMSSTARTYLEAALDIIQSNSIRRYVVDWPPLRTATLERAEGAKTTADTYDAIRYALQQLGDNHSRLYTPDQLNPLQATGVLRPTPSFALLASTPPTGQRLEGPVGYVRMHSFSSLGLTSSEITQHADSYHELLRQVDTTGMCGWIVDLRLNSGGNMWPMLAGIGPVLGEGMVGMFIDPDSATNRWYYQAGKSMVNTSVAVQVTGTPYVLLNPDPAVAVLTGRNTASSGEAQVVAFLGRPHTRSFGQPTWGVPTANRGFTLSDGALLNLTVAWMADRTGQTYEDPIPPDVSLPGDPTPDPAIDPVVVAAGEWLMATGTCSEGGG